MNSITIKRCDNGYIVKRRIEGVAYDQTSTQVFNDTGLLEFSIDKVNRILIVPNNIKITLEECNGDVST